MFVCLTYTLHNEGVPAEEMVLDGQTQLKGIALRCAIRTEAGKG